MRAIDLVSIHTLDYLVDSGFESLERADQTLDFTKLRIVRGRDNHWIQVMGRPLDKNLPHIMYRGFRGLEESVSTTEVAKCQGSRSRANTWRIHQVGTAWLTGGYSSPRKESTQC
jgi:hypothetical protein